MNRLDHTHDPKLKSWIASANEGSDFPIQNLPIGIFSYKDAEPRGGVRIGDKVFDIFAGFASGLFPGQAAEAAEAASQKTLNTFLGLGQGARSALRNRLSELFAVGATDKGKVEKCLHDLGDVTLHVPAQIGDYTDFYVGIHHATNVGKLFRPDNPLLPNYKYVPIGYHGRASSIRPSGVATRRPMGQLKSPDAEMPRHAATERLDYELELGVWLGPGNAQGEPIAIGEAAASVAGFCLLNDWSARDIQAWEYQPLGPFLSKSFGSTISPWIITPEALAPFRIAQPKRPEGDPAPLPYLSDETDQREGAFDIELEVLLLTPTMRDKGLPPHRLSLSNTRHMYWTVAQMVTHHTVNGCNLQPGDFLGSGTISAPDRSGFGSILEATEGGKHPIELVTGEVRRFLEDGDEIILQARGRRDGYVTIGFGECRSTILPAKR
ncbi:fumarylacetoacetase [Rhizobium multihospitium]|uniref:fumarylacetoacetase n=1 Tax=Rhizobium multihospitium TaxID=410764 RepID=A0A1C3X5L8_9HYPH|nr:fumarylacetoacetase [Rhizobium multihospitium]SCB47485.1 fumarylacetoacetate hydrolase [Rhizobium multihospitium]